jgi:hypothetical protein
MRSPAQLECCTAPQSEQVAKRDSFAALGIELHAASALMPLSSFNFLYQRLFPSIKLNAYT